MKVLPRRVVIDTTVVIAAALDRKHLGLISYAHDIVKRWCGGKLRAIVSAPLVEEYQRKLSEIEGVAPELRKEILEAASDETRTERHILAPPPYPRASPDADDDHLFALVRAAEPDYLCSNDKKGVLRVEWRGDTQVVSPMQLHAVLALFDLQMGALQQSELDLGSK